MTPRVVVHIDPPVVLAPVITIAVIEPPQTADPLGRSMEMEAVVPADGPVALDGGVVRAGRETVG